MTYIVTRDGLKHEDELKEEADDFTPFIGPEFIICPECGFIYIRLTTADTCPECDKDD